MGHRAYSRAGADALRSSLFVLLDTGNSFVIDSRRLLRRRTGLNDDEVFDSGLWIEGFFYL